jgi:hypothetical protein
MAVSSITEKLQGEERADAMGRWDHLGAWETCLMEDLIKTDLTKVRQKEEEAAEPGLKMPGTEIQMTNIRHGRNLRPYARRSLVIASPGQAGKSFLLEDHGHCCRTQFMVLFPQDLADIIDGEVLFSQGYDLTPKPIRFRSGLRSFCRRNEEGPIGLLPKLMTEDTEASLRVSKPSSRLGRRDAFDEIGSQCLVLPVGGIGGFEKDPGEVC